MANGKYAKAMETALGAGLNLTGVTIKAIAIDTGAYTANLATHDFLDDIPAPARIATSPALTSPTVTGGVFDAADVTFAGFSGTTVEAIVLYIDTGVESTSRLLCYFDTGVTGLPFTPSGAAQTIVWNASGIFAL